MTRLPLAALLLVAVPTLGWLDSTRDRVAEGNRLYETGKYEEATQRYGEALVDDPESPRLNFNMGAAHYKAGKLDDAVAAFQRVRPSDDDPKREARAAYNAGNTHYRRGAQVAASKPQEALAAYATALASYRRALGIDPADTDAKFNHELVSRKLAELRKQLEEQQKEQDQKQQQQNQQEQPQQSDEQQKDQQQDQAQKEPRPEPGSSQEQPDSVEQQPPPQEDTPEDQAETAHAGTTEPNRDQEGDQPASAEPETAGEPAEAVPEAAGIAGGEPQKVTAAEAAALLDAARGDEVKPEEVLRRMQGAAVAEPRDDW